MADYLAAKEIINDKEELFCVRTGNTTTPLKISEVESYIKSRWA